MYWGSRRECRGGEEWRGVKGSREGGVGLGVEVINREIHLCTFIYAILI